MSVGCCSRARVVAAADGFSIVAAISPRLPRLTTSITRGGAMHWTDTNA